MMTLLRPRNAAAPAFAALPAPIGQAAMNDNSAELHAALLEMFVVRGQARHGLCGLTQLMHATQAGALAKELGFPAPFVVAALLHDIGHLLHPAERSGHGRQDGADRHAQDAAAWLGRYFGPAVTEPIRLHVEAKRYLCAAEAGYADTLSRAALHSLIRQGGPMSRGERLAFEQEPFHRMALALRRIDDAAIDPDGPLPLFGAFWMDIELCLEYAGCLV